MVKVYKSGKGKSEILKTYDRLLKNWGIDFEETDIDTRYGMTHIIKVGNKENPPLVLFQGVGDDSALMWTYNAKALAEKFHIIAVDTIGGPGKSKPNKAYGKGFDMCDWVDDILSALGLDRVHMAGVSNGAYITQTYGAKRPEKTNKLVCMAGGFVVGYKSPGLFALLKMFKVFFPEALFPSDKNNLKLINKLCGMNSNKIIENEYMISHWNALLKYFNGISMRYHKITSLSDSEIKIIRKKALFVIGDSDPISYSEKSIKNFEENEMRYIILKDTGHALNHERADEINEIVIDFLSN